MSEKIHEPSEADSRKLMPRAVCLRHPELGATKCVLEPIGRVGEKLAMRDWYYCRRCDRMSVLSPKVHFRDVTNEP